MSKVAISDSSRVLLRKDGKRTSDLSQHLLSFYPIPASSPQQPDCVFSRHRIMCDHFSFGSLALQKVKART